MSLKGENTAQDRITDLLCLGGRHEYFMVSNAAIAKKWGLSANAIQTLSTFIPITYFKDIETLQGIKSNIHGNNSASSTAHMGKNGFDEMMKTSNSLEEFLLRLNLWADDHLKVGFKNGRDALPDLMQLPFDATNQYRDAGEINVSPRVVYQVRKGVV